MFYRCRRSATLHILPVVLSITTLTITIPTHALTLPEAEQLALSADHGTRVLSAQSQSLAEQSVAAGTWADPSLSIGTMNLPGDGLDPANQGMLELKIEQMFPRGDSANIQRRMVALQSESANAAVLDRQLTVLRDVRLAWLDTWYNQQVLLQLQKDRHLFESLVSVTRSMYSQGRKNQQGLLRAELELSRLEDRIVSLNSMLAQSRAQLSRWLGSADVKSISSELPGKHFMKNISNISNISNINNNQNLMKHPLVQIADLSITQSEQDVALAKEGYQPQWGVELKYGREMGETSAMGATDSRDSRDKFSAMVMLDIPLFTGNRQDRQLSASQYRLEASTARRLETLRQLQGQLQAEAARYGGLQSRLTLFRDQLLPQVVSQSEASLKAYQADAGGFSDVIQSYKARLEMTLEYTRLQADTLQSQARLRYLLPAAQDMKTSKPQSVKGRTW